MLSLIELFAQTKHKTSIVSKLNKNQPIKKKNNRAEILLIAIDSIDNIPSL